jgi:hypothetical protein
MAVSTIGTSGIADANITTAKLADATVTTAKLAASSALVGKNLVQNGAMTVAQRGLQSTRGQGRAGLRTLNVIVGTTTSGAARRVRLLH